MDTKKLDQLPRKAGPKDSVAAAAADGFLFVDYDLLYVDANDDFHGNWRRTPQQACADKAVNSRINRNSLVNYEFAQDCPGSREGIWKFWVR